MARLEALDPKCQAWIRAQVDKAPELSLRQRAELEALFDERPSGEWTPKAKGHNDIDRGEVP